MNGAGLIFTNVEVRMIVDDLQRQMVAYREWMHLQQLCDPSGRYILPADLAALWVDTLEPQVRYAFEDELGL